MSLVSTYLELVPLSFSETGISFPSSSLGGPTWKTERTHENEMNKLESTKCRAGQSRRPNPKAEVSSGSSRKAPVASRKRSGLNEKGSG
jgi:hypothetical protein